MLNWSVDWLIGWGKRLEKGVWAITYSIGWDGDLAAFTRSNTQG